MMVGEFDVWPLAFRIFMKLFKFVFTVLPYHLYNANIGKIFHCNYLGKTFFKVSHKYVYICVGYFCSHCRSMSMY